MIKILTHLLSREQGKFIKSIEIKIPKLKNNAKLSTLFDEDEQLTRLFGLILVADSTMFTQIKEFIPLEHKVTKQMLKEVRGKSKANEIPRF